MKKAGRGFRFRAVWLSAVGWLGVAATGYFPMADEFYSREDFSNVSKIDAHIHLSSADTTFIQQAVRDHFSLFTVNVDGKTYLEQRNLALAHVNQYPRRVAFATTFTVSNWNDPDWQPKTIADLKDSFARGALAVKVWKGIGMELRDKDGSFVMIDDPRFDPIFDFMAKNKIPLISHQGEPKNCWLPVSDMTVGSAKLYFTRNPQHHMFLHPEYPSYEKHMAARDRMIEKHPDLVVIGAHLASLEWSVDELAKRLDKYPNLAVDMASRIMYLQHQATTDWQKVRHFLIKYQDRILYATDRGNWEGVYDSNEALNRELHDTWVSDWTFLVTDQVMTHRHVVGEFRGLKLPRSVVDKIYRKNAERWIPGLAKLQ
ncbi:amidohydrolase family protein [Larkinella insperata]|uniref:Amidohydrolase family protein n=1 Tax=Larkinella insperata TaxID=332158 RepID=A0ABW3QJK9_9BACT|nr:amidohydrolase family protein [Larkinella insperata]